MALPTVTFVKSDATATTLPQTGTSYYDINAADHHGGTSDTPNPLSPSSTGIKNYFRIKNASAVATSTMTNMKMYVKGSNAATLASLGYLRLSQTATTVTISTGTGDSYANGITVTVAGGTGNDELTQNSVTNTMTIYGVTTATGINAGDWQIAVGFYYAP